MNPTTINANAALETDDKEVEDDASCPDANPLVSTSDALLVLLLNIFIPGVGSMVAAYRGVDGFNSKCCGFGIGQMLLTIVVAGTIWSIIHGVAIYDKSNKYYADDTRTTTKLNLFCR